MENTSGLKSPKTRDRAYYRQRQKNRVFTELVKFVMEEAERLQITKKELAEAIGRDPAQITRWLSAPSNFELDTLSDFLLPFGAEMDHKIVRFEDRPRPNHTHILVKSSPAKSRPDEPTAPASKSARITIIKNDAAAATVESPLAVVES